MTLPGLPFDQVGSMLPLHKSSGKRLLGGVLVLFALVSGLLYASFLPPWGLIDEEQHLHYIQYVAEEQSLPVVGDVYLSDEIAQSLFQSRRWHHFHWIAPLSMDPHDMGLEGHSYEAYQPPFYYLVCALLYALAPGSLLSKLFLIRWLMVLISLITLWFAYRTVLLLAPDAELLPYFTVAILAAIPERAMAVSRVNNDVLLEVMGAALTFVCTKAVVQGLTPGRARWMGLLFGLGVVTKTSMGVMVVLLAATAWFCRDYLRREPQCVLWVTGLAALPIIPFTVRNLLIYGDLTGFAAFAELNAKYGVFASPDFTLSNLLRAFGDLFGHLWVIWWKGAGVGRNVLVTFGYIVLALVVCISFTGFLSLVSLRGPARSETTSSRRWILLSYGAVLFSYCVAVLYSYFTGGVPVLQGRFFLPVSMPSVVLLVYGLWRTPINARGIVGLWVILVTMGALSLFFNLLPFHYYWSDIVRDGISLMVEDVDPLQFFWTLATNVRNDKPVWIRSLLPWILGLATLITFGAGCILFRWGGIRGRREAQG